MFNFETVAQLRQDLAARDSKITFLENKVKNNEDLLNDVAREVGSGYGYVYLLCSYSYLRNWVDSKKSQREAAAEREKIAKIAREECYANRDNYGQQAAPVAAQENKVPASAKARKKK